MKKLPSPGGADSEIFVIRTLPFVILENVVARVICVVVVLWGLGDLSVVVLPGLVGLRVVAVVSGLVRLSVFLDSGGLAELRL